jgi:hypothetical protein
LGLKFFESPGKPFSPTHIFNMFSLDGYDLFQKWDSIDNFFALKETFQKKRCFTELYFKAVRINKRKYEVKPQIL